MVINMKDKNTIKQAAGIPYKRVIDLLDKIEKINKFNNKNIIDSSFTFPESSPTKGSTKVSLPLSYRQLSRIQ